MYHCVAMSRLLYFSHNGFCGKLKASPLLNVRCYLSSLTRQNRYPKKSVYQPKRTFIGSYRQTVFQSRSKLWVLGIGAGLVLALGFKQQADNAEQSDCPGEIPEDELKNTKYRHAIVVSRDLVRRIKDEVGSPGLVVGVSVDGTQVWSEGMGYADLENRVPCSPKTVMRIASISKPLTTAAAARLWEEGKLDLDAPVQKYVPEFPEKQYEGENVAITTRMLLSHLGGIRHYTRDAQKVREEKEKSRRLLQPPTKEEKNSSNRKEKREEEKEEPKSKGPKQRRNEEFEREEYFLKDHFESVIRALDLFKDDPLIYKPGTTFLYSTHAFTLLSAVVERAAGERFLDHMTKMFHELGMLDTVPEENDPIIYNRSRFYHLNQRGRIVNCPYVNNSYKWAGGGFLSTVGDLLLFGNALLYSYQTDLLQPSAGYLPGFLSGLSARALWAPVEKTEPSWDKDGAYSQGWLVVEKQQKYGQCRKRRHYTSHTGSAVGASSVLLVLPSDPLEQTQLIPQGVVVTIMVNMQSVGLNATALRIAQEFDKARCK